jgi:hypothetical protein
MFVCCVCADLQLTGGGLTDGGLVLSDAGLEDLDDAAHDPHPVTATGDFCRTHFSSFT